MEFWQEGHYRTVKIVERILCFCIARFNISIWLHQSSQSDLKFQQVTVIKIYLCKLPNYIHHLYCVGIWIFDPHNNKSYWTRTKSFATLVIIILTHKNYFTGFRVGLSRAWGDPSPVCLLNKHPFFRASMSSQDVPSWHSALLDLRLLDFAPPLINDPTINNC